MGRDRPVARRISLALAAVLTVVPAARSAADGRDGAKPEPAPDLSTARSAALAWIDAFWSGDAPTVHRVLVDDEQQRTFIAPALRLAAAMRAMEAAAVKRFGESGRRVSGYPDGSAKAVGGRLKVREEGDRAVATLDDATLPLDLRRVGDQWRVDLSEFARDPRARRAVEASAPAANVAQDVAREVAEGKFKTAEEAHAAFTQRRLAAAREKGKEDPAP